MKSLACDEHLGQQEHVICWKGQTKPCVASGTIKNTPYVGRGKQNHVLHLGHQECAICSKGQAKPCVALLVRVALKLTLQGIKLATLEPAIKCMEGKVALFPVRVSKIMFVYSFGCPSNKLISSYTR